MRCRAGCRWWEMKRRTRSPESFASCTTRSTTASPCQQRFLNLAQRVPSTDMRYFVIAVLIQREAGRNLTEVLGNISALIRGRLRLLGRVQVLSAEGRMSGWVLGLLPFAVGGIINLINPEFMSVLWTDQMGLKLIYAALGMMTMGALWMRQIIKIRV